MMSRFFIICVKALWENKLIDIFKRKTPAEKNLRKDFRKVVNAASLGNEHEIYKHIHETWGRLRFNHEDLFLGGANQPLIAHEEGKPFYIYVSEKEAQIDPKTGENGLEKIRNYYADVKQGLADKIKAGEKPRGLDIDEKDLLNIEVRVIPRNEDGSLAISPDEHGLLHIPHDAFSPGEDRFKPGIFFNWDSAKMIKGMVQDGMVDSAKMMLDNLLYEIDHYGGPLNANGTFALTDDPEQPRCQPPLLSAKVMIIYNLWDQLDNPPDQDKDEWLEYAIEMLEKHHNYWMSSAHLDPKTGLSRFATTHSRPAAEVLHCEPDHFKHAYHDLMVMYENVKNYDEQSILQRPYQDRKDFYYVREYLKFTDEHDENGHLVPESFSIDKDKGSVTGLTDKYFQADTAMRESGLDATRRWGFMAADVMNLLPYDLNCLIAKQEEETARLYDYLIKSRQERGLADRPEFEIKSKEWDERASKRAQAIQTEFWDNGASQYAGDDPMDPNDPMPAAFRDRYINPLAQELNLGEFRRYNFVAAIAVPLWTGTATKEQAQELVENFLPLLLRDHGVACSTRFSGYQWDGDNEFSVYSSMLAEGLER